jgi:hypothetical protein
LYDEKDEFRRKYRRVARDQTEIAQQVCPPPPTSGDYGREAESNLRENNQRKRKGADIAQETEERESECEQPDKSQA